MKMQGIFREVDSATKKKCGVNAEDCLSNDDSFGADGNGRHAVFNALDTLLKDSLERLKMMRENLCLVKTGLTIGYACESKYAEDTATIRRLCLDGKLEAAVWLQGKMVQKGVVPDVFTHNHIVNGLCKMVFRTRRIWALYLFSTMAYAGILPNWVTCSILVCALCEKGLLMEAKSMPVEILKDDDEKGIPDLVTSSIFMDSYFKNGAIIQALNLWNQMLQNCTKVDVVAYNVLINGFCKSQLINLAYGYACEMFKKGLLPDAFTYNILIGALCKEGKISEACYTIGVMSNMGIMPDQITYQIVIRGFCFDGEIVRAKNLLWCAGCNIGWPDFALQLHNEMVQRGYEPDLITYTELVRGFCIRGKMKEAEELYAKILKSDPEQFSAYGGVMPIWMHVGPGTPEMDPIQLSVFCLLRISALPNHLHALSWTSFYCDF
ncbi:Pentatricopeptide repeat-containing protein [Glycine soja]|uniref:Pentatricopeptide repeat-containing protein n=1 Tax=Glycine soja TaxID=3848 RepID=A0A0B2R080_GLYSO|nr:Pentatricopeptide repeat-containing protein [Glycine soja]